MTGYYGGDASGAVGKNAHSTGASLNDPGTEAAFAGPPRACAARTGNNPCAPGTGA